jgi:hypothetical protein
VARQDATISRRPVSRGRVTLTCENRLAEIAMKPTRLLLTLRVEPRLMPVATRSRVGSDPAS